MQSFQQDQQPRQFDAFDEWISDCQFQRVGAPATAAESTAESIEDGVFYFERVPPAPATTMCESSPDAAQQDATDPSSYDMDMCDANNDDLFANLEAVASEIDDGEISLGDFISCTWTIAGS